MNIIELSGCVIIKENKLLLLWKNNRNHYEFPGGKIETGETKEQTAIREAKEEINCDVDLIKYIGYNEFEIQDKHFKSHKFLAEIKNNQIPRITEKETFKDIFWLPINDYKEYSVAPNVHAFCEEYQKNKN